MNNKISKESLKNIEETVKDGVENEMLIIASKGYTITIGTTPQLLSALTCIMNALIEDGIPKELIQKSCDLAGLTVDELAEHAKMLVSEYVKNITNQE